jgi:hypothetical protein
MIIQKQTIYFAEISLMSYLWFLKNNLFLIVTLNFFTLDNNQKIINFLLIPLLIFSLPMISFFKRQYFEDGTMKTPNKTVEITVFGESKVKTFRDTNNKLDSQKISKVLYL